MIELMESTWFPFDLRSQRDINLTLLFLCVCVCVMFYNCEMRLVVAGLNWIFENTTKYHKLIRVVECHYIENGIWFSVFWAHSWLNIKIRNYLQLLKSIQHFSCIYSLTIGCRRRNTVSIIWLWMTWAKHSEYLFKWWHFFFDL